MDARHPGRSLTRPTAAGVSVLLLVIVVVVLVGASRVVLDDEAADRRYSAVPALGATWHATWKSETDASRARELDILRAHGLDWVRIDVGWAMLQPRRGSFDTTWAVPLVERQIEAARARGFKVLVTFWGTPGWANGGRGTRVAPDDPRDYAVALGYLVNRWKGKVDGWEIWNEPNSTSFFSPADPVRYTEMLKLAYGAAKDADPDSTVVLGGTEYVDTEWLGKVYDAGAQGHFDVMAVHPYMGNAALAPTTFSDNKWYMMHVDDLVQLMRARGDGDLPIFFTEFGWSVHANSATTPPWKRGVTEQQQADYLEQSVALTRYRWPQVTAMFWYNSRDTNTGQPHKDGFGLMRRDFTPRPALARMRVLASK